MADGNVGLRDTDRFETESRVRRKRTRGHVRRALLLLGPTLLAMGAIVLWFNGGRFVYTDNAYVRAAKVSISSDVAGAVAEITVHDNQRVAAGDLLFRIDDEPYRIALAAAEAQLAATRDDIAVLQASYRQRVAQIGQAEIDIGWYEREFARQRDLAQRNVASQSKLDEARYHLDSARQRLLAMREEAAAARAKLAGTPEQSIEAHPTYRRVEAEVEKARWDLRRTRVVAPAAGIVAKVETLQVGSYLPAGQPAFALLGIDNAWVEANPKETDLGTIKAGARATIRVDAYPDREWIGRVTSLSPATGSEFALLPPQNSSANWVKVMQRVPLRIEIEPQQDAPPLRAGMSVEVWIETGRERGLADLRNLFGRWSAF